MILLFSRYNLEEVFILLPFIKCYLPIGESITKWTLNLTQPYKIGL